MPEDPRPRPWRSRHLRVLAIAAVLSAALLTAVAGCASPAVSTSGPSSAPPAAPSSAASAAITAASPARAAKPAFPPSSLAAFRAFAATGDASQVHQVSSSTLGLPSCPGKNIYVTVSRTLSGRALEADLAAFFVQTGLINSSCQAFVFAYHSEGDYRAHQNDGFTAGRVALTDTGSGSQRNLEIDTGEVTSETYNQQSEFGFNF
jgi:hypothetical protein